MKGSSTDFGGTGDFACPESSRDDADLGKREGEEFRAGRDCRRGDRCDFIGGCRRAEVLVRFRGGWFSVKVDTSSGVSRSLRLDKILVTSGLDERSRACFRGNLSESVGKGTGSMTFQGGSSSVGDLTRVKGGSMSTSMASVSLWQVALLDAQAVARERTQ